VSVVAAEGRLSWDQLVPLAKIATLECAPNRSTTVPAMRPSRSKHSRAACVA
jgi:hypothetical protein